MAMAASPQEAAAAALARWEVLFEGLAVSNPHSSWAQVEDGGDWRPCDAEDGLTYTVYRYTHMPTR